MNIYDKRSDLGNQEFLPETRHIVRNDHDKHYTRIDWYVLDSHPNELWFDTTVGPCPKIQYVDEGGIFVRTDISILSNS